MELLNFFKIDVVALLLMVLVYFLMRIMYFRENLSRKRFRVLVSMIVLAVALDVVSIYTTGFLKGEPAWITDVIHVAYFLGSASMVGYFIYNVACFVKVKRFTKEGIVFNLAFCVIWIALILFNAIACIFFPGRENEESLHSLLCLQTMILPALGVLVMAFSLETPDYQRLKQTLEELRRTKDLAEQARKDAERANKVKSEFLANMSHELRTPINAIVGNSRFIIDHTKESETLEYAFYAENSGKSLISLVNDILDYTEIESGQLLLEEAPFMIMSLFQDLHMYTEFNSKQKGLVAQFFIDENIPQGLIGDPTRLVQIMFNLISNAIKYTEKGSVRVEINWERTAEKQGELEVKVEDTGFGMTPAQLETIAESFTQGEKNSQGIGLGLTIVTKLLDKMGSKLQVRSMPGEGSVFSFKLALAIEDETPVGNVSFEDAVVQSGENAIDFTAPDARILAVDDYAMNLDLIKGMLRKTQASVDVAMNGEDALSLLETNTYDLLLLDHMMPGMDGVELLAEIRKRRLCPDAPIIIVTANALSGSREQYLEGGFDDYLWKPIIFSHFIATVKRHLPEGKVIEKEMIEEEGEGGQLRSLLRELTFLDTQTGLNYCADDESFYVEMLESYLNNDKRQEIKEAFEAKDMEAYCPLVHALKSTSLSIGALNVSEQAKALESAAKCRDFDFIMNNHAKLYDDYETLLGNIKRVLSEKDDRKAAAQKKAGKGSHILLVDDDAMNRAVGERLLSERFEVTLAKSGEEAILLLDEMVPDLILLDIHMKGMDGFTVLDWLKKQEHLADIPVVFLTADNDREVEIQGLKMGAKEFIRKPFIADVMIERVTRILEFERLKNYLNQEVEKKTKESDRRRQQVERMSRQIVSALTKTVDAKDKYTNGHSERVAVFSREIARRLGKSEEEQENIYIAGLLHDIGKIGIPGSIINKPTSLSDEEYAIIKTHPSIGAEILEGITELPSVAIGARYHHERYDGKGYPSGLVGKEIPEYARIIGVADAYDAMTSRRSYRDPQTLEYVLNEIEKGKGAQFDPEFAEIMIQIIRANSISRS